MTTDLDLTEATAALGRLAMGANYAHDVRLLRLALERLKTLSTPAADDVRDGVAKAMCAVEVRAESTTLGGYVAGVQYWRRFTYEAECLIAELADRALEVRPRGTATDAEVEAAARAMSPRADRWADFSGVARTALEAAREARS